MDIVINNALIPDFKNYRFKKCHIGIKNGIISKIRDVSINGETVINADERLVSPSLIDCHCHIESSYLSPYYFGQFVANYGTTCVIADPHEIANVSGISGVNYFIENAKLSDIDIKFAASSCVPATNIVKGGGSLTVNDINSLLSKDEVVALGEVMDIEPDTKAGRKTTATQLGLVKTKWLIALIVASETILLMVVFDELLQN